MVYSYLLNLYQALDGRQEEINKEMATIENEKNQLEFMQGRISAINEIRSFIRSNYHSKLPRRMQKNR